MKSHDSYREISSATKQIPFFNREKSNTFFNKAGGQFFVPKKGSTTSVFPKLTVNNPNDKYEQEADDVADKVVQRLAVPDVSTKKEIAVQTKSMASTISPLIQKKCASCEQEEKLQKKGEEDLAQESRPDVRRKPIFESNAEPPDDINNIQRRCAECEKEEKVQKKQNSLNSPIASSHIESSLSSSKGGGTSMPAATKEQMENSFGVDFSHVRLHRDSSAVQMNKDLHAQAFTSGSDIYFNSGKYDANSTGGKHLLAHELTHVLQQSNGLHGNLIQRDGFGDVRLAEGCEQLITEVQATPTYKALAPDDKKLADEIISEVNKKGQNDRYQILLKLKLLFDTPEKSEADITLETNVSTATAVKVEKARVSKPKAAKNTNLEEKASKSAKRKWTGIKGKFGGGTYYVDKTSSTNIVVRAKIFLTPAGTGTVDNVKEIKKMEDGIEKAASTKGYLVDIQFVNDASDPDTFTVRVNPGEWEVATNWSGGDPVGFAHELHHMFAFELDRYNYIESHSGNESMAIPTRLHWFREELKKPAGYNDPNSIMNSASHPNDSDVCTVAGLDPATCLAERKKLTK